MILVPSSSDSDVEREVYPLIDLKNATTYKKLSAEHTVTMLLIV